jgi:hypothetical protein
MCSQNVVITNKIHEKTLLIPPFTSFSRPAGLDSSSLFKEEEKVCNYLLLQSEMYLFLSALV